MEGKMKKHKYINTSLSLVVLLTLSACTKKQHDDYPAQQKNNIGKKINSEPPRYKYELENIYRHVKWNIELTVNEPIHFESKAECIFSSVYSDTCNLREIVRVQQGPKIYYLKQAQPASEASSAVKLNAGERIYKKSYNLSTIKKHKADFKSLESEFFNLLDNSTPVKIIEFTDKIDMPLYRRALKIQYHYQTNRCKSEILTELAQQCPIKNRSIYLSNLATSLSSILVPSNLQLIEIDINSSNFLGLPRIKNNRHYPHNRYAPGIFIENPRLKTVRIQLNKLIDENNLVDSVQPTFQTGLKFYSMFCSDIYQRIYIEDLGNKDGRYFSDDGDYYNKDIDYKAGQEISLEWDKEFEIVELINFISDDIFNPKQIVSYFNVNYKYDFKKTINLGAPCE